MSSSFSVVGAPIKFASSTTCLLNTSSACTSFRLFSSSISTPEARSKNFAGVVDRLGRLVGRPAVFGDDIVDVERRVELRPVFERLVDVLVRAVLVASFGKRRAHDEIDDGCS